MLLQRLEQLEAERNRPIWTPLPGPQTKAINSKADITFVGGSAGGGKMLPLSTAIPTQDGWTTIGDLAVGNAVFDERGIPCQVTALHPIDEAPVSYRLSFDDGTQIDACEDHLWLTFDAKALGELTRLDPDWRARRRARRPSRALANPKMPWVRAIALANNQREYIYKPAPTGAVRTTREIAATLFVRNGTRANHAIPVAKALVLPPAELPIDPYVLGAWLGDGNSRQASITCHDAEILARIGEAGYHISQRAEVGAYGINGGRGLIQALRQLNLLNNKHIPQAYLRASIDQRQALLQGLMDTDGNCTEKGACEFTTTRLALRHGMAELLASLGIKAGLGSVGRAKVNGRDCGPKYRFKFLAPFPVFHLTRKAARQQPPNRRTTAFRYIVACDRIDPIPMRCITVDSPSHLYLVGPTMVPTHNTDLILGLAIIHHHRSIIFRREYQQLKGARDRAMELLSGRGSYNGATDIWRLYNGKVIEFGALQKEDDKLKFQGRAHDFVGVDEICHLSETQFRFIIAWCRSTRAGQRSRVVVTGNPPTDATGDWVIAYWAPWLDPLHPKPAEDGELRWFAAVDGHDTERPDGSPFEWRNPRTNVIELVKPISRTFIRAWIEDNPHLMRSGYLGTLQALTEPLRSKLLLGDFSYGRADDADQVIPTAWVLAAQARWEPERPGWVDAIGIDVSRGGADQTVLAIRSGGWLAPLKVIPGSAVPDANAVLRHINNVIPPGHQPDLMIDVIGVGAAVYDLARLSGYQAYPLHAARHSNGRDRSGQLRFANKRSEWYWSLRELLDPDGPNQDEPIALPPDRELLADLTAPHWKNTLRGVQLESKEDLMRRIKRSTDRGDAVTYAYAIPTPPPLVRLL